MTTNGEEDTKQKRALRPDFCQDADKSREKTATLALRKYKPRHYDAGIIKSFLDKVFHTDFNKTEEILCWQVPIGQIPVYPITEDALIDRCERSQVPRQLYYGTATVHPDKLGKIFNRQKQFAGLYVLVLDDIGTKVAVDSLPTKMKNPTYIIETSLGNYQYGYVFERPIRQLEQAKLLVQIIYGLGIADTGGKMPNKLCRLPEGVNGKTKDPAKTEFVTNLVHMDGAYWTPQKILNACELTEDWSELCEDLKTETKNLINGLLKQVRGASPWSPLRPTLESIRGEIDPVLEWMTDEGLVHQDGDEWATIKCPWAIEHSDPTKDNAGYKPLGRGDNPTQRGFNCFHDSCQDRTTEDFLSYVAAADGPESASIDYSGSLCKKYVYDYVDDCVWQIVDTVAPKKISTKAFQTKYPQRIRIPCMDGKFKTAQATYLWNISPARVIVAGSRFDPSTENRIINAADDPGNLYINLYSPPPWPSIVPDEKHIHKFTEFLGYLIPGIDDREYFLDWLAAKVQNMGFRGAGIVMVAKKQGTGRTTLSAMIRALFTEENFTNLKFNDLINDDKYNEFIVSPIVQADETRMVGDNTFYKAYEVLKDYVDTTPKYTRINPKYGKRFNTYIHSSYLLFSNHVNALALPSEDRRFYVIKNANFPAKHEYFKNLNAWLKEFEPDSRRPAWIPHIWNWLKQREVRMDILLSPPPQTNLKAEMIQASKSPLDIVMSGVLTHWPVRFITWPCFEQAVARQDTTVDLSQLRNWERVARNYFDRHTENIKDAQPFRTHNKVARPRIITLGCDESEMAKSLAVFQQVSDPGKLLREINTVDFDASVREKLELMLS